ncbi:MAG: CBS domain-containing protein [Chloroflexota bacterium]
MKTVNQILAEKGKQVWSIKPDAQVYDALKLMADKDVGALLVLEHNNVIGLLSERDYARKVVLMGKTSMTTPVSEIMTRRVVFISPDQSIEECMALMTAKRIRHLPVLENEELIGIITIGDVVKAIISEQEFMISQLENYIKGS